MCYSMQNWLIDLLRDPATGSVLTYDAEGQCLRGDGGSYSVAEGFPVFVEAGAGAAGFDYAAHYVEDAEQFDYFREKTDRLTATHLRLLRQSVVRSVPGAARLVLDVGCGSAFVARQLCPKGVRVVSMDIAPANVRGALSRYAYDTHAALVADAYRLPLADGVFDCIVASEIIEHTVDPQGFLAALLPKLKPGGTLVVSTPYREQIAYSLCIHCNRLTPHNAHLHSFDKEKVRRMVEPLPASIVGMRLVVNKLLLRSHGAGLLSRLGYPLWRVADGACNLIIPKAEHFIITLKRI